MKRLAFLVLLTGCPEALESDSTAKADQVADPSPEAKAPEGAEDALCFKAAGIADSALEGTVAASKFDPVKYKADCEKQLTAEQGAQWRSFYECMVEAGDKTYVLKCSDKSPSPF